MNTSMTGLRWFSKSFTSLCFDKSRLSIGRVKSNNNTDCQLIFPEILLCYANIYSHIIYHLPLYAQDTYGFIIGLNSYLFC